MAARSLPDQTYKLAIGVKRVSLIQQVGNYSFDGQGNKFAQLAAKWNCEIPTDLMIEDKGYSGTDFNRPSIKKAQAMIRAGVADSVAFPWVDRFARDVEGGLATIRMFRELGAGVLLGDLGWYQNSSWFRMQMNMHLTVAQYQRDDIAEKSRWGVEAKLQRGLAHYGAPYGWHMVSAREIAARALRDGLPMPTGKPQNFYERVLDDLEVVLLIGELILTGGPRDGSQRGVCRELDARGILTPKAKRMLARGIKTRLPGWNPMTVVSFVNDEVYSTGIWHYGKREYVEPNPEKIRKPEAERHRVRSVGRMKPREEWAGEMAMPGGPIWTPDEQAAIQEALKRNGEISAGKPTRPRSEGGREALLKNLCTCGATVLEGENAGEECEMSIAPRHGSRINNDGTRSMWYRCTHRHRSRGQYQCDAKSVKAEVLDNAVWERTKQAVCEELDDLITAHYGAIRTQQDERVLARLREEYKLKTAYRHDAMKEKVQARSAADKEVYAGLVAKYAAELARLDRRIKAATSEGEAEEMDTSTIQAEAREAFETEDPADRHRILLRWLKNVKYAHGEAEITIRVRMAVNCKSAEHAIYNKQPLYLTVKTRVAA